MKRTATTLILFLAPFAVNPAGAEEMDELEALQIAVQRAMEKIEPCVVKITTVGGIRTVDVPDRFKADADAPERPREDDDDARPRDEDDEGDEDNEGRGRTPRFDNEFEKLLAIPGFKKAEGPTTGLIISEDGYILTSAWNFDSKPQATIVTTSDGRAHAARLLGIDRAAGLAMLKIDAIDLPIPRFRDPKTAKEGAWSFAVGKALTKRGVEIKYGIISAKNRVNGMALQTDAACSPANYGGPLIDIEGNVWGILVPIGVRGEETNPNYYDSGIGFAIPVTDPDHLIERLGEEGKELLPAFLGVSMDQDRAEEGAKILKVMPDQAAAKAGVQDGDVVIEINGEHVKNAFTLRFAIGRSRAGDRATLVVQRGDEKKKLTVTFGVRPKPKPQRGKIPMPERMPGAPKGK